MINRLDFYLRQQAYLVASYIDYRWHKNVYWLASTFFKVSAMLALIPIVVSLKRYTENQNSIVTVLVVLFLYSTCSVLMVIQSSRLARADKAWERSQSAVPIEAISFILYPGWLRVIDVIWLTIYIPLAVPYDILTLSPWYLSVIAAIGDLWYAFQTLGYYFASVPPSTKERKKKKALDFGLGGILPQLSPIRSAQ